MKESGDKRREGQSEVVKEGTKPTAKGEEARE
jgi:hypothetical protein